MWVGGCTEPHVISEDATCHKSKDNKTTKQIRTHTHTHTHARMHTHARAHAPANRPSSTHWWLPPARRSPVVSPPSAVARPPTPLMLVRPGCQNPRRVHTVSQLASQIPTKPHKLPLSRTNSHLALPLSRRQRGVPRGMLPCSSRVRIHATPSRWCRIRSTCVRARVCMRARARACVRLPVNACTSASACASVRACACLRACAYA